MAQLVSREVAATADDPIAGLMQDYPLTVHHIFWRLERLFGHKEVVTLRDRGVHRYAIADLVRRVYRLANALRRLGIRPGDRVGTLAWNNYRHLELYYAVPLLGGVLHTLNLRLFPDQLEFVIRDGADRFVFVDASLVPVLDKLAGRLDTVQRIVVMADRGESIPAHHLGDLLDYEQILAQEPERADWPQVDERAPAAMCYTSGTTGNPKGVVYTHRSQFLHAMCALQVGSAAISEADVILPAVPMFHANCWGLPYSAGLAGAKLVMLDRWVGDGDAFIELAEAEGATILGGVPTIGMNLLNTLRRTSRRLPKARTMLCGGSAVPEGLMRGLDEMGIHILHAWGMTETSPIATVARPNSQHTTQEEQFRRRLSQGFIQPGIELRIVDLSSGEELPWDGQAFGEVHVRGPWIASGYHHNADPDRFTEDGWLRTGDVANVSSEGYVTLVDRAKDVIKSGGEWVSSVDLENAIMGHPKVAEAAVIGLPHPVWQERPVAYVVARPEHRADLSGPEIMDFLSTRVARWWLPDEVRFIDEVPKTSVGKFDKKALRASATPLG
ncbi:MAG: long-chain fatty acid--CoA ligase [Chloroflexota bacterium]|nr:long-chain fatty acid--CoA ligase [Chloroflexota bacterium]